MAEPRSWLPWLVTGLAVSLVAAGFFLLFERATYEVAVQPSAEAIGNPFLAARRLFEERERQVETLRGLPVSRGMPAVEGTIVFAMDRWQMREERQLDLWSWAERGGNLILFVYDLDPDSLLERLGLVVCPYEPSEAPVYYQHPDRQEPMAWRVATEFRLVAAGNPWYRPPQNLVREWGFDDEGGGLLRSFSLGSGTVAVLAASEEFTNDGIAGEDHAELLVRLVDRNPAGPIWIVYGYEHDSLWTILQLKFLHIIIAGLVLLVFWVWKTSARFGPLLPDPLPIRRKLMEHIDAGGRFLWSNRHRDHLLRATRTAAGHRLALARPDWLHLSPPERYDRLAELTGFSRKAVETAFEESYPSDETGYLNSVVVLEKIRSSL